MSQYDLTQQMIPYLDRQLVFPLLEFLSFNKVYREEDLLKAKYDLVSKTDMVMFAKELYEALPAEKRDGDKEPDFGAQAEAVKKKLQEGEAKTEHIRNVIENPEVVGALKQDKNQNMQLLAEMYQCTPEMVKELYSYGFLQYCCGNYGGSADLLFHFSVLSTDAKLTLSAMWGKLASEILLGNWEVAYEDMMRLKETIDKMSFDAPLDELEQRTWLLHWSLFVFFNHPNGRDGLIEMFFLPQYISTIQNACPWILRYLTAAVMTNRKRRSMMKDLVKIVQQVSYMYKDPVTEFVEALYDHFDFDMAAAKLHECEGVLERDYFLTGAVDDFIENARFFLAEVYCRIHKRIDIGHLTQKLNMDQEKGEKWIVKLIRDTRMDAKVDFENNTVIMNSAHNPIYQQVIERTKAIIFRSQVLNGAIDKREISLAKTAAAAAAAVTAAAGSGAGALPAAAQAEAK
ncbi:eukaryotic translation initiation factor 3 subunit E [Spiromyces aspiralis]|uniref:Eukaryotic translation initiation factor 3 subunit E n=1 Tax=Spiromyces aspiralis TaxID=68401 RepID=A0ACC1HJE4_9FUNG|nr:eukaryotic translation initiation factor 3 subunit E [Spiromyces aspiralis]